MPPTYERLHVQLAKKASAALRAITEREKISKTDAVNRAIQLYDMVGVETADGSQLGLLRPDGSLDRVHVL